MIGFNHTLVLTVLAISLLDFLIGSKGRARVRAWVAERWLQLQYLDYTSTVHEQYVLLARLGSRLFGLQHSWRRRWSTILVSGGLMLLFYCTVDLLVPIHQPDKRGQLTSYDILTFLNQGHSSVFEGPFEPFIVYAATWLASHFGLSLGLRDIVGLSRRFSWAGVARSALRTGALALGIWLAARFLFVHWGPESEHFWTPVTDNTGKTQILTTKEADTRSIYYGQAEFLALVSAFPACICAGFSWSAACFKAIGPAIAKPLSYLLLRVEESPRGLLALLSALLAGAVKAVEVFFHK